MFIILVYFYAKSFIFFLKLFLKLPETEVHPRHEAVKSFNILFHIIPKLSLTGFNFMFFWMFYVLF